jgi:hypothetical protein
MGTAVPSEAKGSNRLSPSAPSDLLSSVPTKKEIVAALFTEEQQKRLDAAVDKENRRLRASEFSGHKLTRNKLVTQIVLEHLARGGAAPRTGVTMEAPMKPKPPAKTPKARPTTKPAAEPKKRGRKPGSGKMDTINLSLEKWVVDWLREQPGGPSPAANAILVRSLRARKS